MTTNTFVIFILIKKKKGERFTMKPTSINKKNFEEIKALLSSDLKGVRKMGTERLLSMPVIINNIEYIVSKYAQYYAMPEMELKDESSKEDYKSELKISYIEGIITAIMKMDLDLVTENNEANSIMSYLTKNAKHNMLFGSHGVLHYMKQLYPDASEHYAKALVRVHKAGYLEHITKVPVKNILKVTGSLKTALTLRGIFTTPELERYEDLKDEFYTSKCNYSALMRNLIKACEKEFTEEEWNIISRYIESGEKKNQTKLVNRFKKFASKYLSNYVDVA